MTNYEKWLAYTSGLSSPQNFIDWGWLYMISAALQRRVWCGPDHQQLFPNMYVILVGRPGIGKGLVIKEISNCLRYWPLELSKASEKAAVTEDEKEFAQSVQETDLNQAQKNEYQGKVKAADMAKPLLIPVCADAITYEALIGAVANSYRRISYLNPEATDESRNRLKVYGHSSICFVLPELSSLMRKRTEDTVNYLLGLYDCPLDYEYVTKNSGRDRVRRGCINIIAGTTPSFIQNTFNDRLMDEGFSSRTFYIYAQKNRKNQFWIPKLTAEQDSYKKEILDHIKELTTLYGHIHIDQETESFLEEWWNQQENDRSSAHTNGNIKLIPYYSRKNIHVMKVAMALHFGESTEMHIPLETFKRAIDFLAKEEKNMHLAITVEGANPLSKVSQKVLEILRIQGKKNFVDLHIAVWNMCDAKGLQECLSFLADTGQIDAEQITDETTDQQVLWYKLKEQK